MTDTHTHLYSRQYEGEGGAAVRRALEAGVGRMVLPGVSLESLPALLELASGFPDALDVAVGLHPSDVGEDWARELDSIMAMADSWVSETPEGKPRRIAAIGEVGLDLHYGDSNFDWQREAFARQLELAWERNLPVVIHSRDALEPTLAILRDFKERHGGALPRLAFHSFTGTPDEVRRIREVCDPWFGINGVVTFKNSGQLPQSVAEIGLDRLLLETDSPYLAPVPNRGKRNESALLPAICRKTAEVLELPEREVEETTDRNASLFFNF